MANKENAAEYVRDMTAEYIERGNVTCEFSCHHSDLGPAVDAIKQVQDALARAGARWIMFPCTTCEEQHGEGFLHVEILRFKEGKL